MEIYIQSRETESLEGHGTFIKPVRKQNICGKLQDTMIRRRFGMVALTVVLIEDCSNKYQKATASIYNTAFGSAS